MILEGLIALGGTCVLYNRLTEDSRAKAKFKKDIKDKWSSLMDGVGSNSENKIDQKYDIEDIIRKHYGFDAIISIPLGKSLKDFRDLIPKIEVAYRGNVIVEYATDKTSMYMRVHISGMPLSDSDGIKFKWYSSFQKKDTHRNISGETYTLKNAKKLFHPHDSEKVIGYRYRVTIPSGLYYDTLESHALELNKVFPVCSIKYDSYANEVVAEIMLQKLDDDEKFTVVKCKPYEWYVGMTHSYKPILLNFKDDPNCIWGGKAGTGKTASLIGGTTNLCVQYTENEINLYIAMLSDKQDLRVFKNTKHCKYYAETIEKAYKMLLHLSNECSRRNKLFDSQRKFMVNIYEYNESFPQYALPIIYLCIDEIASFALNGTEMNNMEKNLKERCSSLMWKIAREGRSAGIYPCLSTQRGDLKNLDANVKGNLGNQVCFYLPNIPSAQTILGNGELAVACTKLRKQREFIANADEVYIGKTLNLTPADVVRLLEPCTVRDKKFLNLDNNGNIVEKTPPKDEQKVENKETKDKIKNDVKKEKPLKERFSNIGKNKK